jgi:hypothetical protein
MQEPDYRRLGGFNSTLVCRVTSAEVDVYMPVFDCVRHQSWIKGNADKAERDQPMITYPLPILIPVASSNTFKPAHLIINVYLSMFRQKPGYDKV